MTIAELIGNYRSGSQSVEETALTAAAKIREEDAPPDGLRSFITLNPRLVEDARALDRRLRAGEEPGPLFGVPVALKDNIDTVDMGCTAGSLLLRDVPVESDAPLVVGLRRAGALLVGKTNLSEWANYRSIRSSSGWSSAGGQTRNPMDRTRSPCGSSSGSAVAVRGGFVLCAVGTETDGSILCPAATAGLVGFRPAVGRVSAEGIVPIAPSQDTAGPMARTVEDAYRLQSVLEGGSARGAIPQAADPERLVLGLFEPGDGLHPGVADLWGAAKERLRAAGAKLVVLPPLRESERIDAAEDLILQYEFPRSIGTYLARRRPRSPYKDLRSLREGNIRRSGEILAHFGQELWDRALSDAAPNEAAYRRALADIELLARKEGMDSWFRDFGVDGVVCPANGPAWKIDYVNGDHYTGTRTPPGAAAGYPALTLPMGTVSSLPVGMQLLGRSGAEERLFGVALTLERLLAPIR